MSISSYKTGSISPSSLLAGNAAYYPPTVDYLVVAGGGGGGHSEGNSGGGGGAGGARSSDGSCFPCTSSFGQSRRINFEGSQSAMV